MDKVKPIGGFNTTLQSVDERYDWINDMIRQRQQLVLRYMQLINRDVLSDPDYKADDPLADDVLDSDNTYNPVLVKQVTGFCELLTDYISHGHFDLYPKIVELMENASGRSLSIARRVLPKLNETTEPLMDFCDLYAEEQSAKKFQNLRRDLAIVGNELEVRFKMEDRLIIGLRLVHTLVSSVNDTVPDVNTKS